MAETTKKASFCFKR